MRAMGLMNGGDSPGNSSPGMVPEPMPVSRSTFAAMSLRRATESRVRRRLNSPKCSTLTTQEKPAESHNVAGVIPRQFEKARAVAENGRLETPRLPAIKVVGPEGVKLEAVFDVHRPAGVAHLVGLADFRNQAIESGTGPAGRRLEHRPQISA